MRTDLLNKSATIDLAADVTAVRNRRFTLNPKVLLGAAALRGSVALERRTERGGRQNAKSYMPRDMALSYLQAREEERTATGVKFAEGAVHGFDVNWVTEFLGELLLHLVKRVRFRLPRSGPRIAELAPDARIVLVSDWGTGEGVALAVAEQMQRAVDEAGGREVHVVHLGDVYYAGTRWEAQHRFLDHWPVQPAGAGRVRSWCLNGNHDMYSAGEGLFEVILTDPRFAGQRTEDGEPTSEFHLRNSDWDVVGIDSSARFHVRDIRGGAGHLGVRRSRMLAERLGDSSRRRLLLSHHQPFTVDDGKGIVDVGDLLRATGALREGRGVDGWFWGHEHRLVTFAARAGVRYSACIGHGAVLEAPARRAGDHGWGAEEFRATFRDSDGDEWRMPGFAVIDLDGATASVTYIDMNGDRWRDPDEL